MQLSSYLDLIAAYLPLALIAVGAVSLLFAAGYLVIYKKLLHGEKRLRAGKIAPVLTMMVYLLFLACITLLGRTGAPTGMNLTPFSSWRKAWYQASPSEWRYIIFNIIAFIPLGFLLPLCSGWFDRWLKILLSGFLCSLLIEASQLLTGRGLFETDDLIHNTLGTVIGYGLLTLLLALINHGGYRRMRRALAGQIPLVTLLALLGGLYTFYQCKELGNLSLHYIDPVHLAADAVSVDCALPDVPETVTLCRAEVGSRADTDRLAEKIFARFDASVDAARTVYYDDTAVYYSNGSGFSLCVDYVGMKWTLYYYIVYDWTGAPAPDADSARNYLEQLGVRIPADAVYTADEKSFSFSADMLQEDGLVYHGSVTCPMADIGKETYIRSEMAVCTPVREISIRTPSEAIDELLKGHFSWEGGIDSLSVTGMELEWVLDSKGYCQPVWRLDTLINGEACALRVPALAQ